MIELQQATTHIVRAPQSAVRSHVSFQPDVAGVCSHSGQYLTDAEVHLTPSALLRESHEFPGLPGLDRCFSRMTHAAEHAHWSWSHVTIRGLSLAFGGAALLYLAYRMAPEQIYASAGWMNTLFGALLAVLIAAGLVLLGWGLWQMATREAAFHALATRTHMGPATADYPIEATYRLSAHEALEVNLDTAGSHPPTVGKQACSVRIHVFPLVNDTVERYDRYREQYAAHAVGASVFAGVVAPDELQGVVFEPEVVEFDHRIVLRRPAAAIGIAGAATCPEFEVVAPYRLEPETLMLRQGATDYFPLHCEARIDPYNSRVLEVRLVWNRSDDRQLQLEACTLTIPDALGKVSSVAQGRVNQEQTQVFWRKRAFQSDGNRQSAVLRVEFQQAILTCREPIRGDYAIALDGLVSDLNLQSERVWNAFGRRATASDCVVRYSSRLYGRLSIDPQRLSVEHEYVQKTEHVQVPIMPDERVVDVVLTVLIEEGFAVQRIAQAQPRKNLAGVLPSELVYWDIFGRHYTPQLLDPIDAHVVLSGVAAPVEPGGGSAARPFSAVTLHLRTLHDPRNTQLPSQLDKIIGLGDASLAAKIERRLAPLAAGQS